MKWHTAHGAYSGALKVISNIESFNVSGAMFSKE